MATANVLVLAALTEGTGNAVTAHRIAKHLRGAHRVTVVDAITTNATALRALIAEERIDVAIGVHALLAGSLLRNAGVPYALVFGGTDLYEPAHERLRTEMVRRGVTLGPEGGTRVVLTALEAQHLLTAHNICARSA